MSYLLDTYALIEWYVQGSDSYEKYFDAPGKNIVTKLTLLEFYHKVHYHLGKKKADEYYEYLIAYMDVTELTDEIIKDAGALRTAMLKKKRRLSYADCVNYVSAVKLGVKLLTRDIDFKDMENVEFVK